jgi:hypothetical protein
VCDDLSQVREGFSMCEGGRVQEVDIDSASRERSAAMDLVFGTTVENGSLPIKRNTSSRQDEREPKQKPYWTNLLNSTRSELSSQAQWILWAASRTPLTQKRRMRDTRVQRNSTREGQSSSSRLQRRVQTTECVFLQNVEGSL